MRLVSIIIFLLFSVLAFGQLNTQKDTYTRCDSLRGSLRLERTCYNVGYYDLDVTVDPENQYIKGSNTIIFRAVEASNRIQIDLFEQYEITAIKTALTSNPETLSFTRECNAVFVNFKKDIKPGTVYYIEVFYEGKPQVAERAPWDGGFVWEKDKEGEHWIGVACQGLGASSWWPNKDYLGDEPDSMRIKCTVPKNLIAVSNGNLTDTAPIDTTQTRYTWKVSYPINNYNVSLNIANYTNFSDMYYNEDGDSLHLDYYVLPYNLEKAKKQFEQVKPMMACFEKYLGPYPFYKDGFALVETPYLGMEHQSAIAYGNEYKTGYRGRDFSQIGLDFDYIIIHETGHEWWGNSVSKKEAADMWIHESFCTYSEALYVECLHGYETAMDYVNARRNRVANKSPMVGIRGVNEEGTDMYDKGMLVLNTLRSIVDNDEVWFNTIKAITEEYKMKNTDYDELTAFMSKSTGKDLSKIFKQYLTTPNIPVFEYQLKKSGKLKYRWNVDTKGFEMPLKIRGNKSDEFITITPTTTFKKMKLSNFNKNEFEIDHRHFYINSKSL